LSLESFAVGANVKTGEITVESVAAFLSSNQTLFGNENVTDALRKLTFTTKSHELRKDTMEARFFLTLESSQNFKALTVFVSDPELPLEKVRTLYLLLRGIATPLKKRILNFALILLSQNLIKKDYIGRTDLHEPQVKADAQYQPNSLTTMFKCLFARFGEKGILLRLDHDFFNAGDFQCYWKDVFKQTAILRDDYAKLPNQAQFDECSKTKIALAIESGALDPINNYGHHMMLLVEQMGTNWMLRGGVEVSIVNLLQFLFHSPTNRFVCCYLLPARPHQSMRHRI
jgi:hypothetical protein